MATKSGRKVRRIKRREFTSTDLVDLGDDSRSEESGEDELSYQSDKEEGDEENEEAKDEEEEDRAVEDAWGRKTYFLAPSRTELQEALEEAGGNKTAPFGAAASPGDDSSPVPMTMHSSGLTRNDTFVPQPRGSTLSQWLGSARGGEGKDPPVWGAGAFRISGAAGSAG